MGNIVTFGNDTVNGHNAFGVDWFNVGYFDTNVDKLNSFQLILIDRSDRNPGDFDIEFNYDQIQWETGDASGGDDGLGGESAIVGFSNGSSLPGTSFQLAGSAIPGELLDINPGGLVHNEANSTVLGRYDFPIVNLSDTMLNVELFSQGDPRWAADSYAGSTFTIQQKGCALSSLAMAINYAGVATDPAALNTLMSNDGDFVGTGVNWDAATRDASDDTLEFHAYRTTDIQYLSQILSMGYPVIVGVNLNAKGQPGHFVLVTGVENGSFVINDPGHADATTLDYYDNDFETRGYVSDPTGDISGLDITTGNLADLMVVNGIGQRLGLDPASAKVLQEIPQGVYFSDCIEDNDLNGTPGSQTTHSAIIYQPLQSTYQTYLVGLAAGSYQLGFRSFAQDGSAEAPLSLTGSKPLYAVVPTQEALSSSALVSQPYVNPCPWTISPTNGALPLSVQFTGPAVDSHGIALTNYYWTLGDGSIDTNQSPEDSYLENGLYYPVLVAINANGLAEVSFGPFVVLPGASFAANPTSGLVPLAVQFAATNSDSLGNPISGWSWDFNDGSTALGQNVSHTYTNSGDYSPSFTAVDSMGYVVSSVGPGISAYAPVVPFTADPDFGAPPLTVHFAASNMDTAGITITKWFWDFDDGSFGSGQNPTHVYAAAGDYEPFLYATNSLGVEVDGSGPSIEVVAPTAAFTASPDAGFAPLAVQFASTNTDSFGNTITSWTWDFGDGSSGSGRTPSHTYNTAGIYDPSFTALNNLGQTVSSYGPEITVLTPGGNLIINGGFETGDFTGWTLTGSDTGDLSVDDGSNGIEPHSGQFLADLGSVGDVSFLSQTVQTTPGASYLLSLWLNSPDGLTPNEFVVRWNGRPLYDQANLPAIAAWTNLQFTVTATGSTATVSIGGQDDQSYLGLDDVSLVPGQPSIASFALSGANLTLTGNGPAQGETFYVLSTTNVALPLTQWRPVATNVLGSGGAFSVTLTNAVNASLPQQFYILKLQ